MLALAPVLRPAQPVEREEACRLSWEIEDLSKPHFPAYLLGFLDSSGSSCLTFRLSGFWVFNVVFEKFLSKLMILPMN